MDFTAEYEMMIGAKDPVEAMQELFPDRLCRQVFKDWIRTKATAVAPEPLARDEFVAKIDDGYFFDLRFLDSMHRSMCAEHRPVIVVGKDQHFSYRLTVEQWILGLQPTTDPNPVTQLSPYMLAFGSGEKPEFVFFQLGELEYTPNAHKSVAQGICRWDSTGFCVVARVGSGGKMDGIYAVYKVPSEDDDMCEASSANDSWGLLPTLPRSLDSMAKPFSCVRVAGSLGELGEDHRLDWEDNILYDV